VTVIALITVLIMTAVAAFGLKQANVVNIAMVLITIGSLILFVITGFQANHAPIITSLTPFFSGTIKEFLYGVALAFVAYAGYGRIATLGEEVRYPKETIPKAIGLTVVISAVLYITVSLVAIMLTGGEFHAVLAENPTVAPLIHVAQVAQLPFSRSILVFGAMTAMLGVLLNLILGLSRTILAMGRRGDMPRILTRLNANRTTPYMAVLFVGVLTLAITSAGDLKLAWTFSALNVLVYYSITNLAALKIKGSERFISPWVSRLGFVGCLFLSVWIESDVWILGSVLLGVGFMIRWVMRVSNRGLKTE
jgi:APA family basic amino acid/polyamine antiporter